MNNLNKKHANTKLDTPTAFYLHHKTIQNPIYNLYHANKIPILHNQDKKNLAVRKLYWNASCSNKSCRREDHVNQSLKAGISLLQNTNEKYWNNYKATTNRMYDIVQEYLALDASLKMLHQARESLDTCYHFRWRIARVLDLLLMYTMDVSNSHHVRRSFVCWLQYLYRERGRVYRKEAAARRLSAIVNNIVCRFIRDSFSSWYYIHTFELAREEYFAAILIKRIFLKLQGDLVFIAICKKMSLVRGNLSDVGLSNFRVPTYYQFHRKLLSQRKLILLSSVVVQAYFRRYLAICNYYEERNDIARLASWLRCILARQKFIRTKQSAIMLQAFTRMKLSSFKYVKVLYSLQLFQCRYRYKKSIISVIKIQRCVQCFVARKRVHLQLDREFKAALILQRFWYSVNNQFSTFVLLGCLREISKREDEFNRRVRHLVQNSCARLIQTLFIAYKSDKRKKSVVLIQKCFRRVSATNLRRTLQITRIESERRARASYKIAFIWLCSKKGRLRCHIRSIVYRMNEELKNFCVIRIQRRVRIHFMKKCARSRRCRLKLQQLVTKKLKQRRSYCFSKIATVMLALRYISGLISEQLTSRAFGIMKSMEACSSVIGKCWRRYKDRSLLMYGVRTYIKRKRAVLKLQKYLGLHTMLIKHHTSHIKIELRKTNPFKTYSNVQSVYDIFQERLNILTSKCSSKDDHKSSFKNRKIENRLQLNMYALHHISGLIPIDHTFQHLLYSGLRLLCLSIQKRLVLSNYPWSLNILVSYEDKLKLIARRFRAASLIQKHVRHLTAKKYLKKLREHKFLSRLKADYLFHRHQNYVKLVWENFQEEEWNKYLRSMIEWEISQVLRHGWEQTKYECESKNTTVYTFVFHKGYRDEYSTHEFPAYSFHEYDAIMVLNRFLRQSIAKIRVSRLRRKAALVTKKELYRLKWTVNLDRMIMEEYSLDEAWSCLYIQSIWRGRLDRVKVFKQRDSMCIKEIALQACKSASEYSWFGYLYEGMTFGLFLNRMGLSHHYTSICDALNRTRGGKKLIRCATQRKNSKQTKSWDDLRNLKFFMATVQSNEYWLDKFPLAPKERMKLLEAVSLYPNSFAKDFEFINYYQGTCDTGPITECIEGVSLASSIYSLSLLALILAVHNSHVIACLMFFQEPIRIIPLELIKLWRKC